MQFCLVDCFFKKKLTNCMGWKNLTVSVNMEEISFSYIETFQEDKACCKIPTQERLCSHTQQKNLSEVISSFVTNCCCCGRQRWKQHWKRWKQIWRQRQWRRRNQAKPTSDNSQCLRIIHYAGMNIQRNLKGMNGKIV